MENKSSNSNLTNSNNDKKLPDAVQNAQQGKGEQVNGGKEPEEIGEMKRESRSLPEY